ncbi:hypothetical protein Lser_V15G25381 [Lactuca serriola]
MPYREAKNGGEGTNGVYALGGIAAALCGPSCRVIQVPPVVDCLQPVVNIVPLQGPVVAEAMFVNREEIPDYPIYRDLVPAAIQLLSYKEIPLAPDAACVGLKVRVVGNDSGEKSLFCLVPLLILIGMLHITKSMHFTIFHFVRSGILDGVSRAKEMYGELKIMVTEHSMGGAMAAFCGLDLAVN